MSTRKRMLRTATTALVILAIGSIGSAGWVGSPSIGPDTVFAVDPQVPPGTLGVGERTEAPPTTPDSIDAKFGEESVVGTSAAAAVAAPAVKRASSRAAWVRAMRPHRAARRIPARVISSTPTGWSRARCSWYGPGFLGHTMAGGGKLTPTSMVVAHRYLPFGTKIQFSYRGKTVIAEVRDRGPYVSGRTFDLGPGTAKALGFSGVGWVSYKILKRG